MIFPFTHKNNLSFGRILIILWFLSLFCGSTFSGIYSFLETQRLEELHIREAFYKSYNAELQELQSWLNEQFSSWHYVDNFLFNYSAVFCCGGYSGTIPEQILANQKVHLEIWNEVLINRQPHRILLWELNWSLVVSPSFARLNRFVSAVREGHSHLARSLWRQLEVLSLDDWLARLEDNAPEPVSFPLFQEERRNSTVVAFTGALSDGLFSRAAQQFTHYVDWLYPGAAPSEKPVLRITAGGIEIGFEQHTYSSGLPSLVWEPIISYFDGSYRFLSDGQTVVWSDFFEWIEQQALLFHKCSFLEGRLAAAGKKAAVSPSDLQEISINDLPDYTSPIFFGAMGIALLHDSDGSRALEQTLRTIVTGNELLPGVPRRGVFSFLDSFSYRSFLQDGTSSSPLMLFDVLPLYDILVVESFDQANQGAFQSLTPEQKNILLDWVAVEGHQLILSPTYSSSQGYVADRSLYSELVALFEDRQANIITNSLFTDEDNDGFLNDDWHLSVQEEHPYYTSDGKLVPSLQNTHFVYSHSDGVGPSCAALSGQGWSQNAAVTITLHQNITVPHYFTRATFEGWAKVLIPAINASRPPGDQETTMITLGLVNASDWSDSYQTATLYQPGDSPLTWQTNSEYSHDVTRFLADKKGHTVTLLVSISLEVPGDTPPGELPVIGDESTPFSVLIDSVHLSFHGGLDQLFGIYHNTGSLISANSPVLHPQRVTDLSHAIIQATGNHFHPLLLNDTDQLTEFLACNPNGLLVLTHPPTDTDNQLIFTWQQNGGHVIWAAGGKPFSGTIQHPELLAGGWFSPVQEEQGSFSSLPEPELVTKFSSPSFEDPLRITQPTILYNDFKDSLDITAEIFLQEEPLTEGGALSVSFNLFNLFSTQPVFAGNLTYNDGTKCWEAKGINASSFAEGIYYVTIDVSVAGGYSNTRDSPRFTIHSSTIEEQLYPTISTTAGMAGGIHTLYSEEKDGNLNLYHRYYESFWQEEWLLRSYPSSSKLRNLQLFVLSNNLLYAFWEYRTVDGHWELGFARYTSASGWRELSSPAPLDSRSSSQAKAVVFEGKIYIVWREQQANALGSAIHLNIFQNDHWQGQQALTSSTDSLYRYFPDLCLEKEGTTGQRIHVAWVETGTKPQELADSSTIFHRSLLLKNDLTVLSPLQQVSDEEDNFALYPNIAYAAEEQTVYLFWQDSRAGTWNIYYDTKGQGDPWTNDRTLSLQETASIYPSVKANGWYLHLTYLREREDGSQELCYRFSLANRGFFAPLSLGLSSTKGRITTSDSTVGFSWWSTNGSKGYRRSYRLGFKSSEEPIWLVDELFTSDRYLLDTFEESTEGWLAVNQTTGLAEPALLFGAEATGGFLFLSNESSLVSKECSEELPVTSDSLLNFDFNIHNTTILELQFDYEGSAYFLHYYLGSNETNSLNGNDYSIHLPVSQLDNNYTWAFDCWETFRRNIYQDLTTAFPTLTTGEPIQLVSIIFQHGIPEVIEGAAFDNLWLGTIGPVMQARTFLNSFPLREDELATHSFDYRLADPSAILYDFSGEQSAVNITGSALWRRTEEVGWLATTHNTFLAEDYLHPELWLGSIADNVLSLLLVLCEYTENSLALYWKNNHQGDAYLEYATSKMGNLFVQPNGLFNIIEKPHALIPGYFKNLLSKKIGAFQNWMGKAFKVEDYMNPNRVPESGYPGKRLLENYLTDWLWESFPKNQVAPPINPELQLLQYEGFPVTDASWFYESFPDERTSGTNYHWQFFDTGTTKEYTLSETEQSLFGIINPTKADSLFDQPFLELYPNYVMDLNKSYSYHLPANLTYVQEGDNYYSFDYDVEAYSDQVTGSDVYWWGNIINFNPDTDQWLEGTDFLGLRAELSLENLNEILYAEDACLSFAVGVELEGTVHRGPIGGGYSEDYFSANSNITIIIRQGEQILDIRRINATNYALEGSCLQTTRAELSYLEISCLEALQKAKLNPHDESITLDIGIENSQISAICLDNISLIIEQREQTDDYSLVLSEHDLFYNPNFDVLWKDDYPAFVSELVKDSILSPGSVKNYFSSSSIKGNLGNCWYGNITRYTGQDYGEVGIGFSTLLNLSLFPEIDTAESIWLEFDYKTNQSHNFVVNLKPRSGGTFATKSAWGEDFAEWSHFNWDVASALQTLKALPSQTLLLEIYAKTTQFEPTVHAFLDNLHLTINSTHGVEPLPKDAGEPYWLGNWPGLAAQLSLDLPEDYTAIHHLKVEDYPIWQLLTEFKHERRGSKDIGDYSFELTVWDEKYQRFISLYYVLSKDSSILGHEDGDICLDDQGNIHYFEQLEFSSKIMYSVKFDLRRSLRNILRAGYAVCPEEVYYRSNKGQEDTPDQLRFTFRMAERGAYLRVDAIQVLGLGQLTEFQSPTRAVEFNNGLWTRELAFVSLSYLWSSTGTEAELTLQGELPSQLYVNGYQIIDQNLSATSSNEFTAKAYLDAGYNKIVLLLKTSEKEEQTANNAFKLRVKPFHTAESSNVYGGKVSQVFQQTLTTQYKDRHDFTLNTIPNVELSLQFGAGSIKFWTLEGTEQSTGSPYETREAFQLLLENLFEQAQLFESFYAQVKQKVVGAFTNNFMLRQYNDFYDYSLDQGVENYGFEGDSWEMAHGQKDINRIPGLPAANSENSGVDSILNQYVKQLSRQVDTYLDSLTWKALAPETAQDYLELRNGLIEFLKIMRVDRYDGGYYDSNSNLLVGNPTNPILAEQNWDGSHSLWSWFAPAASGGNPWLNFVFLTAEPLNEGVHFYSACNSRQVEGTTWLNGGNPSYTWLEYGGFEFIIFNTSHVYVQHLSDDLWQDETRGNPQGGYVDWTTMWDIVQKYIRKYSRQSYNWEPTSVLESLSGTGEALKLRLLDQRILEMFKSVAKWSMIKTDMMLEEQANNADGDGETSAEGWSIEEIFDLYANGTTSGGNPDDVFAGGPDDNFLPEAYWEFEVMDEALKELLEELEYDAASLRATKINTNGLFTGFRGLDETHKQGNRDHAYFYNLILDFQKMGQNPVFKELLRQRGQRFARVYKISNNPDLVSQSGRYSTSFTTFENGAAEEDVAPLNIGVVFELELLQEFTELGPILTPILNYQINLEKYRRWWLEEVILKENYLKPELIGVDENGQPITSGRVLPRIYANTDTDQITSGFIGYTDSINFDGKSYSQIISMTNENFRPISDDKEENSLSTPTQFSIRRTATGRWVDPETGELGAILVGGSGYAIPAELLKGLMDPTSNLNNWKTAWQLFTIESPYFMSILLDSYNNQATLKGQAGGSSKAYENGVTLNTKQTILHLTINGERVSVVIDKEKLEKEEYQEIYDYLKEKGLAIDQSLTEEELKDLTRLLPGINPETLAFSQGCCGYHIIRMFFTKQIIGGKEYFTDGMIVPLVKSQYTEGIYESSNNLEKVLNDQWKKVDPPGYTEEKPRNYEKLKLKRELAPTKQMNIIASRTERKLTDEANPGESQIKQPEMVSISGFMTVNAAFTGLLISTLNAKAMNSLLRSEKSDEEDGNDAGDKDKKTTAAITYDKIFPIVDEDGNKIDQVIFPEQQVHRDGTSKSRNYHLALLNLFMASIGAHSLKGIQKLFEQDPDNEALILFYNIVESSIKQKEARVAEYIEEKRKEALEKGKDFDEKETRKEAKKKFNPVGTAAYRLMSLISGATGMNRYKKPNFGSGSTSIQNRFNLKDALFCYLSGTFTSNYNFKSFSRATEQDNPVRALQKEAVKVSLDAWRLRKELLEKLQQAVKKDELVIPDAGVLLEKMRALHGIQSIREGSKELSRIWTSTIDPYLRAGAAALAGAFAYGSDPYYSEQFKRNYFETEEINDYDFDYHSLIKILFQMAKFARIAEKEGSPIYHYSYYGKEGEKIPVDKNHQFYGDNGERPKSNPNVRGLVTTIGRITGLLALTSGNIVAYKEIVPFMKALSLGEIVLATARGGGDKEDTRVEDRFVFTIPLGPPKTAEEGLITLLPARGNPDIVRLLNDESEATRKKVWQLLMETTSSDKLTTWIKEISFDEKTKKWTEYKDLAKDDRDKMINYLTGNWFPNRFGRALLESPRKINGLYKDVGTVRSPIERLERMNVYFGLATSDNKGEINSETNKHSGYIFAVRDQNGKLVKLDPDKLQEQLLFLEDTKTQQKKVIISFIELTPSQIAETNSQKQIVQSLPIDFLDEKVVDKLKIEFLKHYGTKLAQILGTTADSFDDFLVNEQLFCLNYAEAKIIEKMTGIKDRSESLLSKYRSELRKYLDFFSHLNGLPSAEQRGTLFHQDFSETEINENFYESLVKQYLQIQIEGEISAHQFFITLAECVRHTVASSDPTLGKELDCVMKSRSTIAILQKLDKILGSSFTGSGADGNPQNDLGSEALEREVEREAKRKKELGEKLGKIEDGEEVLEKSTKIPQTMTTLLPSSVLLGIFSVFKQTQVAGFMQAPTQVPLAILTQATTEAGLISCFINEITSKGYVYDEQTNRFLPTGQDGLISGLVKDGEGRDLVTLTLAALVGITDFIEWGPLEMFEFINAYLIGAQMMFAAIGEDIRFMVDLSDPATIRSYLFEKMWEVQYPKSTQAWTNPSNHEDDHCWLWNKIRNFFLDSPLWVDYYWQYIIWPVIGGAIMMLTAGEVLTSPSLLAGFFGVYASYIASFLASYLVETAGGMLGQKIVFGQLQFDDQLWVEYYNGTQYEEIGGGLLGLFPRSVKKFATNAWTILKEGMTSFGGSVYNFGKEGTQRLFHLFGRDIAGFSPDQINTKGNRWEQGDKDGDIDEDGLTNFEEINLFETDPLAYDSDKDGLSDKVEVEITTYQLDPWKADTDNDGLNDYLELYHFQTKPDEKDTDNDSLTDGEEVYQTKTNPLLQDSDGDGLTDDEEIALGTNPNNEDSDADGLTDQQEQNLGLQTTNPDSDGDGLSDSQEWLELGTNPQEGDTDNDGIPDGYEYAHYDLAGGAGLDPTNPNDACLDADNDGLTNVEEYQNGTCAWHSNQTIAQDSDLDGLTDYEEIYDYQTEPINDDCDGDGLLDGEEFYETDSGSTMTPQMMDADGDGQVNVFDPDADNDGLWDGQELILGTCQVKVDTDGDNLSDYDEVYAYQTNATLQDTDYDGLTDYEELFVTHTDPLLADMDGDLMCDFWEIEYGLDPADPADATFDPDNDNLTNLEEYQLATNPLLADTDEDGLLDGEEVQLFGTDPTLADSDEDDLTDGEEVHQFQTDPTLEDTDRDGIPDGFEVAQGWDPLQPTEGSWDSDQDGLANGEEFIYQTDPFDADTDNDGIPDGFEVNHGLDPLVDDAGDDLDNDCLSNFHEYCRGTDPSRWDTDLDTLSDYDEHAGASGTTVPYPTDPTLADSDYDGLDDGAEIAAFAAFGSYWSEDLDGDGLINLLDDDADGDGLTDGYEYYEGYHEQLGVWLLDLTDPTDGLDDQDQDGLCYAIEITIGTDPYDSDTDDDSMPDGFEYEHGLNATVDDASEDLDGDGLSNLEEYQEWTMPDDPDSDDDTLPDGFEVDYYLDPLDAADATDDPDFDGLTNRQEYQVKNSFVGNWSNPINPDSDGDSLYDSEEVAGYTIIDEDENGLPLFPPIIDDSDSGWRSNPLLADSDADGLLDAEEYQRGLNPLSNDTDQDELTDYDEIYVYYTLPFNPDSDGDLMYDGFEVAQGLNPLDTRDASEDPDHDGLNNAQEYQYQTSLQLADTDGDGLLDGEEVNDFGTNPTTADTDNDDLTDYDELVTFLTDPLCGDSDADGLLDGAEVLTYQSDPLDRDSDNDYLLDGEEVLTWGTNPILSDTDSDGLLDGCEVQGYSTNPLSEDTDNDGLDDFREINSSNTDPCLEDTDGDGLDDYAEVTQLPTSPREPDSDFDGLLDGQEYLYGTDPTDSDSDNDHLTDYEEIMTHGTDPLNPDSDSDNLPDGQEIQLATDPLDRDTDNDRLLDGREVNDLGTDPLHEDSDGDGLTDYEEVGTYQTSPLRSDSDGDHLLDGEELLEHHTDPLETDTDNDGLGDGREIELGTDPCNEDSDGDTLSDGWEVRFFGSDPLAIDTDGDGLRDDREKSIVSDPRDPDSDDDGLTDLEEYQLWTFAKDPDSDDDELPDGYEVNHNLNPLNATDATLDPDLDGLSNLEEYLFGSDPHAADADEDGLDDFAEKKHETDPFQEDTDEDNLTDGEEVETYLTNPLEKDTDGDGLLDAEEVLDYQTNPLQADTDEDQLSDYEELIDYGTNPLQEDSDDDQVTDYIEINYLMTSPINNDTDGDGLLDGEENSHYYTNPLNPDTDGDTLTDYEEVIDYLTCPYKKDTDQDGLLDQEEVNDYSTDPLKEDSDEDTLTDGLEIELGTNPLNIDSDEDGLPDGFEVSSGLDPLNPADAERDQDQDGLTNIEEYSLETEINDSDTDEDGLLDGWEVREHGTNPLKMDTDEDKLSDGQEITVYHSNPLEQDTDRDGLLDGEEVLEYQTDPLNQDSDNDGLTDKEEIENDYDPNDPNNPPTFTAMEDTFTAWWVVAVITISVIISGGLIIVKLIPKFSNGKKKQKEK
ncbi:MAG: hypothetical protein GF308_16630 [Candidatus Heimdallarchaeota archaeon]|nr:hypothetical protein [Candidatus Heimdallarchaeota archaeon]